MKTLEQTLQRLSKEHRKGLQWFVDHAGTEQPWVPAVEGILLVTKAKGIYKPTSMDYALSVRQTIDSSYLDRDPIYRSDGTWIYQYYQEGDNPDLRDELYTNRALMACWRDQVPVGIMRQTRIKPSVRYRILGVALVAGWEDGYFFFEGFSSQGRSRGRGAQAELDIIVETMGANNLESNSFEDGNLIDARQRIIASIIRRQGQKQFRQALLEAYGGKCAMSTCGVLETLEAAHIVPYYGPQTNHVSNGILLRADIHTLFDLGKISIDTQSMRVIISPSLVGTAYEEFSGKQMDLPADEKKGPNIEALNYHRKWAGL